MKTALVTGASSGIGEAFAAKLASQKMNLVLVARSKEKLEQIATQLTSQYGIRVDVIPSDLSKEFSADEIFRQTERLGLQIDLLINNAGFASSGEFHNNDPKQDHNQVMVNISAVVDLTHAFLPGMVQRRHGTIINVASTAAFQPIPYMALYGATKAFVLSFSEALWAENRKNGVHVMALCPGPTETNFFNIAGDVAVGKMQTTDQVVQTALKALYQKKSYTVVGMMNYLTTQLSRFLPRRTVALIAGSLVNPQNRVKK